MLSHFRDTLLAIYTFQESKSNINNQDTNRRSRRSGSGGDLYQTTGQSQDRKNVENCGNGPLAILRRSFRRSASKKHTISSYQVQSPFNKATPSNKSEGSQERIARKFSNQYQPTSSSGKLDNLSKQTK